MTAGVTEQAAEIFDFSHVKRKIAIIEFEKHKVMQDYEKRKECKCTLMVVKQTPLGGNE